MIGEWMERFNEFATHWLWLVLLAAWRALPILVLVIGIGVALRRRLTPSYQALLLTIVVVRLLLPVSVGSPLSLHQPIDHWFLRHSGESFVPAKPSRDHVYGLLPNLDVAKVQEALTQAEAEPVISGDYSLDEILSATILCIVVSVSFGMLLRSVLSHIRFAWKLRSCRRIDQQYLVDLLLRECDSLAVGRRPTVREVPSLAAPAVFGFLRPTICLPPGLIETLSEQELRWVIRHELAHIRRRDIPVVIMAALVNSVHWFNPMVWWVVSRLRGAMEAAADQLAVQALSKSEISAYGHLLLRLAENSVATKKSPTLGLISFASGKHLKQRVELLMRQTNSSGKVGRFMCAGLVAAVVLVGLTDASEPELKMPALHLVASDSIETRQVGWLGNLSAGESDGPAFFQDYDVTAIFATMPQTLTDSELTPQDQLIAWLGLPSAFKDKMHLTSHTLSAELTAGQHELLRQTLDVWSHGEPKQISIETRFIQTNISVASSIDWVGRRVEGLTVFGLGPAIAARVDEPELAHLIRTVSSDRSGNILFAPKVTLFEGQKGLITDQVQRPFVTGVLPQSDGRMQPVVSIVEEGLSFVVTPRTDEEDSVTLAFKVKATSIGKVSYANLPIRTSNREEPQFTVQVPATEQYEVSSSVKLTAGESIVVAIPRVFNNEPGADAETTMIVALTPRIVSMQELSVATGANNP